MEQLEKVVVTDDIKYWEDIWSHIADHTVLHESKCDLEAYLDVDLEVHYTIGDMLVTEVADIIGELMKGPIQLSKSMMVPDDRTKDYIEVQIDLEADLCHPYIKSTKDDFILIVPVNECWLKG